MIGICMYILLVFSQLTAVNSKHIKDDLRVCQQRLLAAGVDWTSFYTGGDTVPSGGVDIIMYKNQDDGKSYCGLVLKDCSNVDNCNCPVGETPLLFQTPDGWDTTVSCKEMTTYLAPEQRTIDDVEKDDDSSMVQSSLGEVPGEVPPSNAAEFERMKREVDAASTPVNANQLRRMIADVQPVGNNNNQSTTTTTSTTSTASTQDNEQIWETGGYQDLLAALDEVKPEGRSLDTTTDVSNSDDLTTVPEALEEDITTKKSSQPQNDDSKPEETTVKDSTTTSSTTTESDIKDEDAAGLSDLSSLQTKYYVVVVFVIIFVIILVVIGAVIFYKMKKSRGSHQIISPGPGDNEPLTPGASGTPAFNFDKSR